MTNIALVDDHVLLRNGLATIVQNIGYHVLFEAGNGEEFIAEIINGKEPEVVLMDINMPYKDGFEATLWLKNNKPDIKVLALSMLDDEKAIIRMLKNGARGYILKESDPKELKNAIESVIQKGFHYSEMVTGKLMHSINKMDEDSDDTENVLNLNEREIQFLKFAATEMTYKEIAGKMFLSPRTIDGYRDALFEKLGIKTRVGLVIFAIRNSIVQI